MLVGGGGGELIHSTLLAAALGTLEFDLLYERATSSLHCTVLRAKVKMRVSFVHSVCPSPPSGPPPTLPHLLL